MKGACAESSGQKIQSKFSSKRDGEKVTKINYILGLKVESLCMTWGQYS
jgi:hypothetical protein